MNEMNKLRGILARSVDTGKMPKGCSPVDVFQLFEIYTRLTKYGVCSFFSQSAKDVLDKCGIPLVENYDGVGWTATNIYSGKVEDEE